MEFCGQRLAFARSRRELTQKALAERIGIETRTIVGYESGEYPPSGEVSKKFSTLLRFPVEFFFQDEIEIPKTENVSFRSLSRMSAKKRDAALCSAALAFNLQDWIEKKFSLPPPHLLDLRTESPEAAATILRQHWGLGILPIENMIHLLEVKGIKVFSIDEKNYEIDAFSLWKNGTPFIFLNTQKSTERSRFDAAHELGHLVLHKHEHLKRKEVELEANEFASAFLMPKESVLNFETQYLTIGSLIEMKKTWITSVAALVIRLHKLGRIKDWQYRTLCITIAERGLRTKEPEPAKREFSKALEKIFRELWIEGITKDTIARDLKIPIEEINKLIFGLLSKDEFKDVDNSSLYNHLRRVK